MKNNTLMHIIVMVSLYFLLRYYGGSFGQLILQPIILFVTYLHELGHAFFGIITGGRVLSLNVATNGSGLTQIEGGRVGLTIAGGYIGSALFGNILFYLGVKKPDWSRHTLLILAIIMLVSSIIWFSTIQTLIVLLIFSLVTTAVALKTNWSALVVMCLGLLSTIHIIEDTNIGPSSDLAHFELEVGLFSATVWRYIWLSVVLCIFILNLRLLIYKKGYLNDIHW